MNRNMSDKAINPELPKLAANSKVDKKMLLHILIWIIVLNIQGSFEFQGIQQQYQIAFQSIAQSLSCGICHRPLH